MYITTQWTTTQWTTTQWTTTAHEIPAKVPLTHHSLGAAPSKSRSAPGCHPNALP
jgi:hypothetical protein